MKNDRVRERIGKLQPKQDSVLFPWLETAGHLRKGDGRIPIELDGLPGMARHETVALKRGAEVRWIQRIRKLIGPGHLIKIEIRHQARRRASRHRHRSAPVLGRSK